MPDTDKPDNQHRTADLYFAAFLKVAGVPFQGTERKERQVQFIFENDGSGTIRDLQNEYFARKKHSISALSYADEIKAMKSLTHMQ